MNSIRKAFKLSAVLLEYPEREWTEALSELREEISSLGNPVLQSYFLAFLTHAETQTYDDLCEEYVNTFDYHGVVSLNLTYHVFKESRERGGALIQLRKLFREAGIETVTEEMPDYLPMVLEFLAIADDAYVERVLKLHVNSMMQLEEELSKKDSPYAFLLKGCIENARGVFRNMEVS